MELPEIEKRIASLQSELNLLRDEFCRLQGRTVLPGYGPVGLYSNDPLFADAEKATMELIERDRKKDLARFDRRGKAQRPKGKRKKLSA